MRTSAIIWIIIIIVIAVGGWYYYTTQYASQATVAPVGDNSAQQPSTAAGVNGSPNQGNLGQPDTGAVQQPGADGAEGTVIGGNVALSISRSATLGSYLVAYNGQTVYTFTKDKTGTTTCYGQCEAIWPPYTVGPEDNVQNVKLGVTASKVGTITRADGTIQVTYDGHPLYLYSGDWSAGDIRGQNFNKVWFVVKP